jgi:hypothetical protein
MNTSNPLANRNARASIYEFDSYEEFIRRLAAQHDNNPSKVLDDHFYVNLDQWKLGKAQHDYVKKIIEKED